MPAYYHQYKIEALNNSVNSIVEDAKSYNIDELQERLYFLSKRQNVAMVLTDSKGYIIFGRNEQHIKNKYMGDIPVSNQIKEYNIKAKIKLKNDWDTVIKRKTL